MSRDKASTMDADLQKVFGNPVPELYEAAAGHDAPPALAHALELRSFLALTEEQVTRIRDRVHADMDPALTWTNCRRTSSASTRSGWKQHWRPATATAQP